jgi:hypothetical protein
VVNEDRYFNWSKLIFIRENAFDSMGERFKVGFLGRRRRRFEKDVQRVCGFFVATLGFLDEVFFVVTEIGV